MDDFDESPNAPRGIKVWITYHNLYLFLADLDCFLPT